MGSSDCRRYVIIGKLGSLTDYATGLGHHEVVELFLAQESIDINACTVNDHFSEGTALQSATEAGDVKMVQILLKHGADPNIGGGALTRPIIAATARNEPEILRLLIEKGVKVNVNGRRDNTTPLILSGMYMTKDDIKVLLDAGADINLADPDGDTPLIMAALCGEADSVEYLLERGADVQHVSHSRNINALQAALREGDRGCLELLINHVSGQWKGVDGVKNGIRLACVEKCGAEDEEDEGPQERGIHDDKDPNELEEEQMDQDARNSENEEDGGCDD
jgi:ankyrin repeat protein